MPFKVLPKSFLLPVLIISKLRRKLNGNIASKCLAQKRICLSLNVRMVMQM
jgi:hypothetical protein